MSKGVPNKIAIASDHAGFALKSFLIPYIKGKGIPLIDCGTLSTDPTDYPEYAQKVAHLILSKQADLGILICGSGIGMSMAANRYPGIRAALCWEGLVARLARQHDNANVLVLGERLIGSLVALECMEEFLKASFEGGRHLERVQKIELGGKRDE